jgi:PAS domain-containing protein
MNTLSRRTTEHTPLATLRSRAAAQLKGTAATKGPLARATDALGVLHALASSPQTAADALTLLHELQVHQVELDLQTQELHESRAELESALRRQIELYDGQPVACFTIDAQGVLHELNLTAAGMLGLGRDAALGLTLDAFLDVDGARRLRAAMARATAGGRRPSCRLTLRAQDGCESPVLACIGTDPAARRYLVSLMPTDDEPESPTAAP